MAKLGLILLVVIGIVALFYIHRPVAPTGSVMRIGNQEVSIEIADDPAKQVQGLSGRYRLDQNSGMLFVFDGSGQPSFWMKDMKFPLDFIWIADGRVVEITSDVPAEPGVPESELRLYKPTRSVDSMLEVNAGWAASKGVKTGDETKLLYR